MPTAFYFLKSQAVFCRMLFLKKYEILKIYKKSCEKINIGYLYKIIIYYKMKLLRSNMAAEGHITYRGSAIEQGLLALVTFSVVLCRRSQVIRPQPNLESPPPHITSFSSNL
jgi:hypothetical protein